MFQTAVLASGSKGNCLLVRSDKTTIVIDVGISAKNVWIALEKLEISRDKLKAIIVSHEHSDHINGIGALSRLQKIPVYITSETYKNSSKKLGDLHGRIFFFEAGKQFRLGDLLIHPFTSSHDAVDSCNFTIQQVGNEHAKLAVATDVGYPSKLMLKHLKDATTIIIESNHDEILLREGPYPWDVKQRIISKHGHLSNSQAVGVISQIIHSGLKRLILAHLSEINNTPEHAKTEMERFLQSIRTDIDLVIADQHTPTPLYNI